MTTTFISHRMFVAALNHDEASPTPVAGRSRRERATGTAADGRVNQLTVEQLAAFAARHWSDFPFVNGFKPTAS